jgi:uncharacterized protein YbjT (DUF2867 family)
MARILVTGATGAIGSRIVQGLAAKPDVTVCAAVHVRPAEALPDGVEAIEVDYEQPETVRAAAEGVDVAYMVTPSVPGQVRLADRLLEGLKTAQVPRLVRQSSIGAERTDARDFMREHTETEHSIVASGIPHTFLRPNSFMSNFVAFYAPDPEGNIRMPWGDAGVSLVDPRDVADVATEVLTAEGHEGRAYTLTGPNAITVEQIAAAISDVTGRTVTYIDMPEEEMRQGMLSAGLPPVMVDPVMDLLAGNKAGETAVVTDAVQELTGHPARSFEEFARDFAEVWQQG